MSSRSQSVTVADPVGADPVSCEEFGYGLGRPDGILVIRYRSAGLLDFGENRQDFLHQFYWSPRGVLSVRYGVQAQFVGSGEVFWVRRAVTHEVSVADQQTVYRVCLRQVPPALEHLRAGTAPIDAEAARLLPVIGSRGCDEQKALAARGRIMTGLGAATRDLGGGGQPGGPGFAMTVARALSHDPGDPTRLDEWADRLHISVKTLQRDFEREFGMSYSQWRTRLRLLAARVLLETQPVGEVAHRVGYASPSAFIAAFTREYGHTPGRRTHRPVASA